MGKAARLRAANEIAVAATVGKDSSVTQTVARRIRKQDLAARRQGPKTRLMRHLEHVAATQPAEHRR